MPITVTDTLEQSNRNQNVSTGAFFHLMSSVDVDFSVEKILLSGESAPIDYTNKSKYIVLGPSFSISPAGVGDGDIVIYINNQWQIYVDVSNPETAHPIVYDKRTEKFYHHTVTNGWVPIINSKSSMDGGTF